MVNDGICSTNRQESHLPVLLEEVLGGLACGPGRHYVDCTVGAGGLAARLLACTAPQGVVVGIDRDRDAIARCRVRLGDAGARLHLRHGNFSDLKRLVAPLGLAEVHGVVFDLGVSSPQLDDPGRGFSFQTEGPLDMRMDQSAGPTAADLLRDWSEPALADVLARYGEERFARRIARALVRERARRPLATTADLVDVVRGAVPASYRHGRIHCATRTFQALRIAVNRELDVLEPAFRDAVDLLAPGGRLCILAFHSLEDRIAKHTLAALARGPRPVIKILTKKPLVPSETERRSNPRARSAKLRVAERLPEGDRLCA